jgi:hypothetical protein
MAWTKPKDPLLSSPLYRRKSCPVEKVAVAVRCLWQSYRLLDAWPVCGWSHCGEVED